MTIRLAGMVEVSRVLDRGALSAFLEETARFYQCRLVVLDKNLQVAAHLNPGEEPPDLARIRVRQEEGEWRIDSPHVSAVTVYGSTIGFVSAAPLRPGNERSASALALHSANLMAEMAAREYELDDLSQEILDSYEEVNLFYDVAGALSRASDVAGVCSVILGKACEIIKVNRASILLLDESKGEMNLIAARGIPDEEWADVRIPVGKGISGRVLVSRTPRLVDDVDNLPSDLLKGYERYTSRSFISVPLCLDAGTPEGAQAAEVTSLSENAWIAEAGGRAIGVINMTDKEDGADFTSGDLKLLTALASQAAILIENMRLIEVEKELRIARDIQRSLLPEGPPVGYGAMAAGKCVPAKNVGGDYFDFLPGPDGSLSVVIADVSGHNMASALMMAVARSAIRAELKRSEEPGEVLERVNALLYEDLTRAELFLSLFCLVFDPAAGTLKYANAGHNPPIHLRPGGTSPRSLDADGLLTGVLESVVFEQRVTDVRPGDVILLYTDGIVEAVDRSGDMFGVPRLGDALRSSASLPADGLLDHLFQAVQSFSGGAAQADDMTAVALKIGDIVRR